LPDRTAIATKVNAANGPQPPHVHPVDRIVHAVAVPVRVAAFRAEGVERCEAPGVGVIPEGSHFPSFGA
jgi:hypothetical protein